jgi:hypothetical protein
MGMLPDSRRPFILRLEPFVAERRPEVNMLVIYLPFPSYRTKIYGKTKPDRDATQPS